MTVFQLLSGAMSVAAAQSVFINRLLETASARLPDVDRASIVATGATDLERVFPGDQLVAMRESYLDGLHAAWAMAIAFAGAALLTGLTLGFKRIQTPAQEGPTGESKKSDGNEVGGEKVDLNEAPQSTTKTENV